MFKVHLFGSPTMIRDGEHVKIRRTRSKALLAYLLMHEMPQSREELATLLWGSNNQKRALANLRRELARLKNDVGEGLIFADRQSIGIEPEADLWLDVQAFREGVQSGKLEGLVETVQLYTDDFMAGFTLPDCPEYDDWQFFQAEELRSIFAKVLQKVMAAQEKLKDYEAAAGTARRWLALDTLYEPAHRSLMRYNALSGQLSAAIRQYHICVQTLETELGIEPEAETTALFEAIQAKEIAPPSSADMAFEMEPDLAEIIPARRHNLPKNQDAFIGRLREIREIHHHLTQSETRLLTLRGIGGIGKTRLAIQAVSKLIDSDYFPDGLFVINLAGIDSVNYIVPAIADALDFPLSDANDPLDQLVNYLGSKDMLLLLDNFEHLQPGSAKLSHLLQYSPNLKLLVTSRHQLNLAGEHILLLEGLSLAQTGQNQSSAVRLFEERASQLVPNLNLEADRPFIQAICQLVDGMPLAIEMCAAWIHTINCQEILAEIRQGLDLLESSKADLPDRHQSIRAVFNSSFQLLKPAEQETLLQMAVFRGSFSYSAAKEVAGATLMQLRSFVEKSLLSTFGVSTQTRYQIHPLLRQFAREEIETDKAAAGELRQAQFFADLLAGLDKKRCTTENEQIVPNVIIEVDNLRSIWRWLSQQIAANKNTELICHLLEQLLPAWGHAYLYEFRYLEGKQLLNSVWTVIEAAKWETAASSKQRWAFALVAAYLAQFCAGLGQFDECGLLCKRALSILSAPAENDHDPDIRHVSETLRTWARADIRLGNYDLAEEKLVESINMGADGLTLAWSIYSLGVLFSNTGRYEKALETYPEALKLFEACHDQSSALITTSSIGSVYGRQRKFEEAIEYFEKVALSARQMNQKVTMMIALSNLAFCLRQVGRTRRVDRYFAEALAVAKELGAQRWQAVISQDFGKFLLERGDMETARQLLQSGLEISVAVNSEPDVLAGLLSMAEYQAQIGRFEEALTAAGFVMKNNIATAESQSYAADFWEELSSELPPIFTQRAKARLENAKLDDVLQMLST